MDTVAIRVLEVSHRYGTRQALDRVSLEVPSGQVFALLGPNGGGKSTLFRLLATLIPIQSGRLELLGLSPDCALTRIRRQLGVVFQSPSVDRKLTVWENVAQHAALYGNHGTVLRERGERLLRELGLLDRRNDLVETLSGGLRRRVELAKGMLHQPKLLLMDEPSTGLDPAARGDLWTFLRKLRDQFGTTIALTTHLLDEADRADQLAILDRGRVVATGTAAGLRSELGGDTITIQTSDAATVAATIRERFSLEPQVVDQTVRLEVPEGHQWIARLMDACGRDIQSITLGKPTLEDVFIHKTGHRFWTEARGESAISTLP